TLAAWADGALDAQERRAAETHAADCLRCQTLLASMVRMNPPQPAAPWWRVHFMGWVVPMTATAVVIIWMYMPAPRFARQTPVAIGPAAEPPAKDQIAAAPAAAAPRANVQSEPSKV